MLEVIILLLGISALFSYINHRVFRLPITIGLFIQALVLCFGLLALQNLMPQPYEFFFQIVERIDFEFLLMDVMLSFLLFAGAMHVDIRRLQRQRLPVLVFATFGVAVNTVLVGSAVYGLASLIELNVPYLHCLLFGALIAPTDPIAVLSILKSSGVSGSLEMKIEGESLFNDGLGVVVFLTLLSLTGQQDQQSVLLEAGHLFLSESVGGILYGLALGLLGKSMLYSSSDAPKICVMITLAIASVGYAVASLLHVSGPLAMVVAGLYIGHSICSDAFSDHSRRILDIFWEMLDDTLNAILFVMIGLVAHNLNFRTDYLLVGMATIIVVLGARAISVGILYSLIKQDDLHTPSTIFLLTWGGLRGGISVALALSLTGIESRQFILFITFTVVAFSIIVQGLTIGPLAARLKKEDGSQ
ncbi:MAG: sodium:proton antiporter [Saprospiraceae bacterium]|nr:sodium:proton antiporter [Saprospiraceae bacterium]